jgi:hypothetical protein
MTTRATDWKAKLEKLIDDAGAEHSELADYVRANAQAIEGAVAGRGPDAAHADAKAGARMVVNISSSHVPAFCEGSRKNEEKPYKNSYDLGKYRYRIGNDPPARKLKDREIVDRALPIAEKEPGKKEVENVYFGAVELNGAGIRFYGDVCLVLTSVVDGTVILDRNSYDLIRAPIKSRIEVKDRSEAEQEKERENEAWKLCGLWENDLGNIAALKGLQLLGFRTRRYTTGQISDAVRNDEDYMEILRIDSFGTNELQEARFSAAEAAHDALTGDRLRSRPAPRWESLMWRHRRRRAEEELRRNDVRVQVMTTSGRIKD